MRRLSTGLRAHGLRVAAFATLAATTALAVFVWYLWTQFDVKSQALARQGSEAAEYMRISTTVLGSWILPALVVVAALAATTFAASLRRSRPAAV